jgi:hypothetical protein
MVGGGEACKRGGGDGEVMQFLVGKPKVYRPLGSSSSRWEYNIKMNLQEVEWGHGLD